MNTESPHGAESFADLDTHADNTVLGGGCLLIHDTGRRVDVSGFESSLGSLTLPIVTGAVAYDHPVTGKVYILVFHQAIHCRSMANHLICPMQCRVNDVVINDVPKICLRNPDDLAHSIQVDDPMDPDAKLHIPLMLRGVTSCFNVRRPTTGEFEDVDISKIDMTYESPEWDPADPDWAEQEASTMDSRGRVHDLETVISTGRRFINLVSTSDQAVDFTSDDHFHDALQAHVNVSRVQVKNGHRAINSDMLAEKWLVSPEVARRTLERTTQRGVRTISNPSLSRRFRTNDRQLRYKRLRHDCFTDTMMAKTKSRRGEVYTQVYATGFHWSRAYPMKKKSDAHETLSLVFQRDGVPPRMIMDGSKEQTQGRFKKKCQDADCRIKQTEPYSPWQNAAESAIRELKKAAGRKMVRAGAPKPFWADAIELEAYVRSHTAHDIYSLQGEVPETVMSGETADISQFCEFAFYDWIMFRDEPVAFPDANPVIGRYLGPAIDVGPALTAKILKANGEVVYRSTYRHLTDAEVQNAAHVSMRIEFDVSILDRFGPETSPDDFPDIDIPDTPEHDHFDDVVFEGRDEEWVQRWRAFAGVEEGTADGADDEDPIASLGVDEPLPTPEQGDNFLHASVMLPRGNSLARGKVIGRKRDSKGNPIGRANDNAILDSRIYRVEFDDGDVSELTANVIAESMYASCDDDGNEYLLMDSFVDHKSNAQAVTKQNQRMVHRGRNSMRRSTVGWHLCVQWKDGSTSWQPLKDLKEAYPLAVAEYAIAQGIDSEPAFNWWVKPVLRKREHIIALVKKRSARFLKKTHKFGIEVPRSVAEAYALDKKNGNTLWADSIAKEMKNVRIAFKILENGERIPIGYQRMRCHIIFDVKMEDFRRKARLVAGGHMTDAPPTITYASVVSRETVRIALTLAGLNDLQVKVSDIENAYITAPCTEKIWTVLGPEFGSDAGKQAIVVRALYGLKSAGASFRNHLADCMNHLGFKPCLADPDLWMMAMVRPSDGSEYYAYVLVYVDDVMVIHHDAEAVLLRIDKYFKMKPGSIGDPDVYLGATIKKMRLANGVEAWASSPSKYVRASVDTVTKYLTNLGDKRWSMPKKAANPFEGGYEPEIDVTPHLNAELASWYASLIGMLRWMVEIGRVDIITEVSKMASQMAAPREGHLDALLHIFGFLKINHNSRMAYDPSYPTIDMAAFKKCDWKQFYGDVKEAIPSNAPEPRGKEVDLRMYVDSDHAGEKRTRRSRTGFFVFLNTALVQWFSKQQATIETSVFGAEFVAMKIGMESLRGLRYKLRMMGVEIDNPSYIYGDNMSVIHNTQRPESMLKKKSNSICYHAVRESVAMGEALTGHIGTNENVGDLATKVLYGQKRRYMVSQLLYDIYDD